MNFSLDFIRIKKNVSFSCICNKCLFLSICRALPYGSWKRTGKCKFSRNRILIIYFTIKHFLWLLIHSIKFWKLFFCFIFRNRKLILNKYGKDSGNISFHSKLIVVNIYRWYFWNPEGVFDEICLFRILKRM